MSDQHFSSGFFNVTRCMFEYLVVIFALYPTGLIWSRYSLVIIPKNWGLFTVNFFVGCAGGSQLFRIWRYNQELKAKEKEQLQQKEP